MKATILGTRKEGSATCYLCSVYLGDYIAALPTRYKEYDIQREIVRNVYLDHLVDTVLNGRHIPPMVLVLVDYRSKPGELDIQDFKILDGLQRTHRLEVISKTIDFCL